MSTLALFLLLTALPWTTVWGAGFNELRALAAPAEKKDWSSGRADEHAQHQHDMRSAAATLHSRITIDDIVERVSAFRLDPPVRVYLPTQDQPFWRVRSETLNVPRARELEFDPLTGTLLQERGFADKSLTDRVVGVGIAAHQGQLFGPANQALGLFTALGLLTLCTSAIVMWWRRRPDGRLGVPAPRVTGFRIGPALGTLIAVLSVLLPVFGISLLLLMLAMRFSPVQRTA